METTASFLTQSYRLIFLTVAGLLLASCAAPQPPTETPRAPVISAPPVTEETPDVAPRQRINIGLLLPLSGPQASLGKTLLQAAILALHDSDDQRLHLLPEDTRGDPTVAESALQRLLEKKADIIIGPLFAHNTQRITPLAQQANIPVLSLSSDYKVAAPGIYLMGFRPEEQVSHILQYAATHGFDQYAVLLPETSYGQRILATIGAQIAQLEKTLSAISFYPPDTNQLFEPVKNLADYDHRRQEYVDEITFLDNLGENDDFAIELKKEIEHKDTLNPVDFDAVLLPEGGALLRTLAPMLSYYDVDTDQVKLLGTGLWDDPLLMKEPQLLGGWFAGPKRDRAEKFRNRYADIFGERPPRISTLAYDAVALAAILTRQHPVPDYSAKVLTDPNGFDGLDGLFRFHTNGLNERALAIYEIQPDGFTIISPSQTDFMPVPSPAPPHIPDTLDYHDPWTIDQLTPPAN